MSNLVHRPCPSCGEDNAAAPVTPFGNVQWPIKACRGCGFVYLETAPVYERLVDEFAWEATRCAVSGMQGQKLGNFLRSSGIHAGVAAKVLVQSAHHLLPARGHQ